MQEIELLEEIYPNIESVHLVSNYLGYKLEQVESIRETFANDTIFSLLRPSEFEGNFAYLAIQEGLTAETRTNQYRKFFDVASLAMSERGETSSEIDFIIVIGEKTLLIFDSSDYRKRLVLTTEKLKRNNSKYLHKLRSLQSHQLVEKYVEDEDFGDIELVSSFKTELFRFAIADDEQFINKTRVIRLNFWKRIREDKQCRRIINKIFFKQAISVDETSEYYGEVISAVLDTLVLRYILVRILEGRFGYENELAKKSVEKIGLGTTLSIDKLLESKAHFDSQQKTDFFVKKKNEQLNLFDFLPDEIDTIAVSTIKEEQSVYMEEVYGGDLYVSDIAKAATQIEKTLKEEEYALIWKVTSSTDLDFNLEDVTPGTIGEQYEQTLQMKLIQDSSGNWVYNKDNEKQRSQGSFYTSAQITDYIIEQTLGKKLSEIKEKLQALSDNQKMKLLKDVLKLKMADISSGGGTFLAGAVRRLGDWYTELEKLEDVKELLHKIPQYKSIITFQKYAVNHMIYGVDLDLKALIVSSFALTLESLGDTQEKLPELIGKTLIHQNSLVSVVPESLKLEWFETYKDDIAELYREKKKWISQEGNTFVEAKNRLQNGFKEQAADYLATKKYSVDDIKATFSEKHMDVLEFNLPEVFFDSEGNYSGGFDIIFGNPPYIQLQKKQIFSDIEKYLYQKLGEFHSYQATGDIYSLFFERGSQLLKSNGLLGYITSNKFLRAGYGQTLRNYLLEYTNPYLLVNLGSGMFGATVDTSILAFEKSSNKAELQAIDLMQRSDNPKERLENMSNYIEQEKQQCSFKKDESWLILSPIEQSIKQKIEAIGIPLKDWDIRINRGILTGYNEAFIIDKVKRDELIAQDPKSADIIRPILRGRDIKRYGYEFANLYLISTFPSKKYNIDDYPAVKDYLLTFDKRKLEQSGIKNIDGIEGNNARKKTNNQWFETQDSIAYWDDFNKPKVVYPNMTKYLPFYLDNDCFMVNQKCFIMTGEKLAFLTSFLNSKVFKSCFKDYFPELQGGTRELSKIFFERIPIPKNVQDKFISDEEIYKLYNFTEDEINWISSSVRE